ncbi:hypothetical protein [Deinococcus sp. NW-56]|uniref:GspH/FimT family pseudopilin n=1 Tax=Deinococcus sp. NW-56 TaxID=2080419 RepID=UPI001F23443A|nr:hypothetical protein [Deinococcus sp. NW-56]
MLLVIAIIGILAAIGMVNYARWRASSAVMEGAQQFAQAVNAARTGAKKANACWQIGVLNTTATNTQYQIKEYAAACPAAGSSTPAPTQTRTYTMPAGTQLAHSSGSSTISFRPPYGTADSSPDEFKVRWANNTAIERNVRLTGIFGKVVIK